MLLLKCPSQSKSTVLTDSDGAFSSLTAAAVTSSSHCSHSGLWSVLLRRATTIGMVWFCRWTNTSVSLIHPYIRCVCWYCVRQAGLHRHSFGPESSLLSFSLSSTVNRFLPQKRFQEECLCSCRMLLVSYRSLQSSEQPYLWAQRPEHQTHPEGWVKAEVCPQDIRPIDTSCCCCYF